MLKNYITQVRRPKGVLSEREGFVSRAAQASAAACIYRYRNSMVGRIIQMSHNTKFKKIRNLSLSHAFDHLVIQRMELSHFDYPSHLNALRNN